MDTCKAVFYAIEDYQLGSALDPLKTSEILKLCTYVNSYPVAPQGSLTADETLVFALTYSYEGTKFE